MATYTTIADSAVDSGSPVDEALVTALRDNAIAIAEGATGAPRVEPEALNASPSWVEVVPWTDTANATTVNVDYSELQNNDYESLLFLFRNVRTSLSSGPDTWTARLRVNDTNTGISVFSASVFSGSSSRGVGGVPFWDKDEGIGYGIGEGFSGTGLYIGTAGTRVTGLTIVCLGGVGGEVRVMARSMA